jgi:hypothetical protein
MCGPQLDSLTLGPWDGIPAVTRRLLEDTVDNITYLKLYCPARIDFIFYLAALFKALEELTCPLDNAGIFIEPLRTVAVARFTVHEGSEDLEIQLLRLLEKMQMDVYPSLVELVISDERTGDRGELELELSQAVREVGVEEYCRKRGINLTVTRGLLGSMLR